MPFAEWTRVGPRNYVLGVARPDSPRNGALLGTYIGTPWLARGDVLDILNVFRKVAQRCGLDGYQYHSCEVRRN